MQLQDPARVSLTRRSRAGGSGLCKNRRAGGKISPAGGTFFGIQRAPSQEGALVRSGAGLSRLVPRGREKQHRSGVITRAPRSSPVAYAGDGGHGWVRTGASMTGARSHNNSLRALAGRRAIRCLTRALAALPRAVTTVGRRRRVRKRRCCGGCKGCARKQNCSELACLGHVHLPFLGSLTRQAEP
jgi:hypothetical protein